MRRIACVAAMLVSCATVATSQESRAHVSLPGWKMPFPIEEIVVDFPVAAPTARVYRAVASILDDLQIPIDTRDSVGGLVGSMRFQPPPSLAGRRLSQLLDCGSSATGARADSYKVTATFLALLDAPDAQHTKLRLGFVGSGQDRAGVNRVQCSSTGVLEGLVSDAVKRWLDSSRTP